MSMTDFYNIIYIHLNLETLQNLKEKLDKKEYANIVKTKPNQL